MLRKSEQNNEVQLTDCIGPAFYDMHNSILTENKTYYNLMGGRGSLKSSTVSIEIVLGVMKDRAANAVCYRKVRDTLATSVYDQICWAIDKLGVSGEWHCTSSPLKCTYKPTGQVILFKGLDKAKKSKSIKVRTGYIKYLWFEEFDEFEGPEEIRSVEQSVIRGGDVFYVFKSMNPPKSKANWANAYLERESTKPDVYTSVTTYLSAPPEWLGKPFINQAEWIKEVSPKVYEHEYLGKAIGNGTDVFDNLEIRRITDEEINRFDRIYMGVDWGWYPDPYQWVKMHYDAARRTLYIFDEYRCNKTSNKDTARYLMDVKGVNFRNYLTCDSAEPKSIADYKTYGLKARAAEKGPDSVRYGMKWLQSLNKIVIDPVRCPNVEKEFREYEYELNKDGEPTSNYPDANNHSIDATRYAMEKVWKRKGK